ncbi:alpha/beta hydrolase [Shewanella sp. FJAT-52076]|uniref:alpha/beta hydrolase n=1 Tax=Shewanella sp. FJAT-52076 TaxID=2864202 RepID=UPI001C656184|nr:alpha/beta hydrolase [Shewanella sp. FJAT-52076]QYJ75789.1 alpha/beta hydrolase [Shewanella sp. FJAT-52076]
MKAGLATLVLACSLTIQATAGQAIAGTVVTTPPDKPSPSATYLFYLHGRIIENSGPRPTDPRFGLYDYPAVLDALASRGAVVISAQRPANTNSYAYAGTLVAQIEQLIEAGVPERNIVVVGFSKGGGITTRVSSYLHRPELRYVLLASCPEGSVPPSLRLSGRVLSIYEASDALGASCRHFMDYSEKPASFKELKIDTGKLHGAFYQPLPEWLNPVLDWVHGTAL